MAYFPRPVLIAAAGVALAALVVAENKHPLRRRTQPAAPRRLTNLALGAGCAAMIAAMEEPLCQSIARRNEKQVRGVAGVVPGPLRLAAAIAAMDYGIYLWHAANHKLDLLWRLHRVHHVDADLDVSTAVRFHPLDMLVSLPWRLAQVRMSGIDPLGLRVWRRLFNASILFHHANLRLPQRWERRLGWLFVTPGMHAFHHSVDTSERDSNYSSGLTLWDWLHGTLHQDRTASETRIGVDDAQGDGGLGPALLAPFGLRQALPRVSKYIG